MKKYIVLLIFLGMFGLLSKAQLEPQLEILERLASSVSKNESYINDINKAMVKAGVEWRFPTKREKNTMPGQLKSDYNQLNLDKFPLCDGLLNKKDEEIERLEKGVIKWLDIIEMFSKFNQIVGQISFWQALLFTHLNVWNTVPGKCYGKSDKDDKCKVLIKEYNEKIKFTRKDLDASFETLKNLIAPLKQNIEGLREFYKETGLQDVALEETDKKLLDLESFVDKQVQDIEKLIKDLIRKMGPYVCVEGYMKDERSLDGKCLSFSK